MKKPATGLHSFAHAILAVLYISGVAWFLSNMKRIFGPGPSPRGIWPPLLFLLLFVMSATIVGSLVLGRPLLMYLDGEKKEAVRFFGYTLGWLVLLTLLLFAFMIRATR